jgi:transcriptional regulator with XRE-family HTH domain
VKKFGPFFKERRLATGQGLREFCLAHGYDPGNISKLERGVLPPPDARAKLDQYAADLGLPEASPEWYEFFDLAAAESGSVPAYMMSDQEVMAKVPLLFRTIHDKGLDAEQIELLIERIRTS